MVDNVKEGPKATPKNGRILTTIGRMIFNDILVPSMPFYNCMLSQKGLVRVVADCHE